MAQQMTNGSYRHGDITVTNRMTDNYAVVGEPFFGAHQKPQDARSIQKRKARNAVKPLTIVNGHLVKKISPDVTRLSMKLVKITAL